MLIDVRFPFFSRRPTFSPLTGAGKSIKMVNAKDMIVGAPGEKMPIFLRLYIYGIHGYFTEIMFTAAWEFIVNINWKFPGCTSVWSLLIYSISVYVIELMYLRMRDRVHVLLRAFFYLMWSYTWEFSTGYVLSYFNACPWDYTAFDLNVVGLITLEYAPLWYFATLISEQVLIKNILSLHWCHSGESCHVNDQCVILTNGHAALKDTKSQ